MDAVIDLWEFYLAVQWHAYRSAWSWVIHWIKKDGWWSEVDLLMVYLFSYSWVSWQLDLMVGFTFRRSNVLKGIVSVDWVSYSGHNWVVLCFAIYVRSLIHSYGSLKEGRRFSLRMLGPAQSVNDYAARYGAIWNDFCWIHDWCCIWSPIPRQTDIDSGQICLSIGTGMKSSIVSPTRLSYRNSGPRTMLSNCTTTTATGRFKLGTHWTNVSLYRNNNYIKYKFTLLFDVFSSWKISNTVTNLQRRLFPIFSLHLRRAENHSSNWNCSLFSSKDGTGKLNGTFR